MLDYRLKTCTEDPMNFPTALEGYWIARKRDFSPNTIRDYSLTFDRFNQYIGTNTQIETITTQNINAFLNHIKTTKNLGDKTMANVWMALSSFFTWAEGELKITHPISKQIPCPKYRRPVIEEYSEAEVKSMLAACEYNAAWHSRTGKVARNRRPTAKRDQSIVVTLLETGIRASELCDLTLADYDKDRGQLNIRHGKGDKQRFVYVADSARRYLWRYLATRTTTKKSDPLFATDTNNHMSRDSLLDMIYACADRAGVKKANVHKFRHTFAINFLRNGGNLLELKKLLGHEKLETLQIYVELAQADLARVMRTASPADRWRL